MINFFLSEDVSTADNGYEDDSIFLSRVLLPEQGRLQKHFWLVYYFLIKEGLKIC